MTHEAERERRQQATDRQRQADHEDRARCRQEADHRAGQDDPREHPDGAADQAEGERLAHDDPQHLTRGCPGRAEQPELPGSLPDRHGHRVADEERADDERHRPEQERHADEPFLGRCEPARGVGRRLDDERLGEGVGHGRRPPRTSGRRRGRGRRSESAKGVSNAESSVVREAMITSPPSSAASPVSSMSPTIRSPGIPSRRPEMSSVSPSTRPLRAAHEAGTSASVGASADSAMPSTRLGLPDGGIDLWVDAEHEQREDALVLAGAVEMVSLRSETDAAATTPGSERMACTDPRAESLVGERAEADVRAAEQVGGGALEGLLRRGADDDRCGHRRHPERDAEHGQRGAQRAGEQASPGERREGHRSLQAESGEAPDERLRLVVAAATEGDLVADLAIADDEDAVGVRGCPRVVRHEHDRLAEPIGRVPQQVEDLGASREVEVAGRLIGQEDGRPRGQRARQRHALLLARRELVGTCCALSVSPTSPRSSSMRSR